MEIEKLKDMLRNAAGGPVGIQMCQEAADALEQLQSENNRLRRERDDAIRQLKFFAPCAGCKWYRGVKGCAHELGCDNNHDYYEFVAKED